jgi:hypothetical protein
LISKIPLSKKIFPLTTKIFITQFRENNFNTKNIFLILISFSGLFFLVAMYLWSPQSTAPSTTHYSLNETIILFLFLLICILGIFAALYPSKCKTLLKFQNDSKQKTSQGNIQSEQKTSQDNMQSKQKTMKQGNIQFEGHHPDCGKFSSHTLTINGKKYCPGCFGLSVGATIAIVGLLVYYFVGYSLMGYTSIYGEISFWIGVFTVFASLLLIIFLKVGIKMKFISNMALVTGSFLVLVGLDIVKGNLITELYFLILVIFWILTRIAISETSHETICQDCLKKSFCVYE